MSDRPSDGRRSRVTALQLAAGMATFGSATPVSRIVAGVMPVFVGALLRCALGALVLSPAIIRHRDQLRRFERHDWMLVGVIALFGMVGFTVFMLYGMRMVPGAVGAIVMSTAPAVTAAASILFLRDRPTWRKLAAIALAVGGVLILHLWRGGGNDGDGAGRGGDGAGNLVLGSLLVFAAVCCETVYTLVGKRASERADPVLVAGLAAALSLPLFLPLAIWQWSSFDPASVGARGWIAVAWYGAGTLALGTWLWYSGIARTEGVIAAAFMGVMPASALILSYVLLDEPFRWSHLAGFAAVFAGVLLMSWEHARMMRR